MSMVRGTPGDVFSWLGSPQSGTLGWTSRACWGPPLGDNPDVARFAECHDRALASAQSTCAGRGLVPGTTEYDTCVTAGRDILIDAECIQFCQGGGTGTRQCVDPNAQIVNGQCQCKPGFNKIGDTGPDIRCARPGAPAPKCPASCPAGQECVDPVFGCVPKCPPGVARDPGSGLCQTPAPSGGTSRSGAGTAGIILLAVAALAGIGLALAGRGGGA